MPLFCAVVNCGNKSAKTTDMGYYRYTVLRRQKWIQALKRADPTERKLKYARVCSRQFSFSKLAYLEHETSPDWVPSLHMGHQIHQMMSPLSRFKRLQRQDAMVYL
ncbi:uncharacterized protein LOC123005295 [Tribolium madens]|uniref:uncharacterized protein LOC123005295 n=1 Tax=Tribolium madens TaxID=41895 RepID=UPI001CF73846|nr:uncharacterized protein LOC123005295 [Tribolium madens]